MSWLEANWKLSVARGVLGIVFGVVAMVWPVETLVTLVVLWGIWALVDGIGALAGAFRAEGGLATTVLALTGVLALVVAVFAIFRPGMTGTALSWLLGIWLIVRGLIDAVATIAGHLPGSKLLSFLAAGLSIVAGVIFVANPGGAAVALAFWLGLIAFLWGITFLVVGLITRSKLDDAQPAAPATA